MHLKDPYAHRDMIEVLEGRYKAEECSFRTIYGTLEGYRIYADRGVAEKIEMQTYYAAEIYNVDVRQDQRYMAERDIFPCGYEDESRFSPDFEIPLSLIERLDRLPAHGRRLRGVQSILWAADYRQDEGQGSGCQTG